MLGRPARYHPVCDQVANGALSECSMMHDLGYHVTRLPQSFTYSYRPAGLHRGGGQHRAAEEAPGRDQRAQERGGGLRVHAAQPAERRAVAVRHRAGAEQHQQQAHRHRGGSLSCSAQRCMSCMHMSMSRDSSKPSDAVYAS